MADSQTVKPRVRTATLKRADDILGVFTTEYGSYSLSELAAAVEIPKASAHRLLTELINLRWVKRDSSDPDRYTLGPRFLELAAVYTRTSPLRQRVFDAIPYLARQTKLTCQLGLLNPVSRNVIVVAVQPGRTALRAAADLGQELPLHATALGKAILGQMTEGEIRELVPESLPKYASQTVTQADVLIAEVLNLGPWKILKTDSQYADGLKVIGFGLPRGVLSEPAAICLAGASNPELTGTSWEAATAALEDVAMALRKYYPAYSDHSIPLDL